MAAPSPSQQQVLQEFNARRQRLQDIARKVEELSAEAAEHETVIKALEPMEAGRKCFRLIGDVLVERTVGETLPAVTKNKDNLESAIQTLVDTMKALEKQLSEYQAKHNIRLVDKQGRPIADDDSSDSAAAGGSGSSGSAKPSQGVLVDKK